MCLMIYIATIAPLQERVLPSGFAVQEVHPDKVAELRRTFSMPHVRFVGRAGSCSCDVPHVICDHVIEYYDGMFESGPERQTEIGNVRDLLDLVHESLPAGGQAELYPVEFGSEGLPPKGRIELRVSRVHAAEFFFIERFLYVLGA